jgi:hypothetical protein
MTNSSRGCARVAPMPRPRAKHLADPCASVAPEHASSPCAPLGHTPQTFQNYRKALYALPDGTTGHAVGVAVPAIVLGPGSATPDPPCRNGWQPIWSWRGKRIGTVRPLRRTSNGKFAASSKAASSPAVVRAPPAMQADLIFASPSRARDAVSVRPAWRGGWRRRRRISAIMSSPRASGAPVGDLVSQAFTRLPATRSSGPQRCTARRSGRDRTGP